MIGFFGSADCDWTAQEFLFTGRLSTAPGMERPQEMAPDQKFTISVYDSLASLERLRPEWDALLAEYPCSTTFSTYEWLASWWRAFSGKDRLLVLAFRDARSALVGLAPLAITTIRSFPAPLRLLLLMGDGSHDSDNLDIPVRPGREKALSGELLGWMNVNAALWDVCQLNTLPADSLVASCLLRELQARSWTCLTSTRPQTVVELPDTWESYLKALSAKERGKVGIRARKLEKKYAVRIRRCSEERELDSLLGSLCELHGKHWQLRGLPGTLHSPARRRFYGDLARQLLARKRLEFWVLELDEKVVAAQFGLRHGASVFSLQEGFDPEYASDSVGYVLRSQVLKQLIGEGVRRYDFLGGTDESKMRWGAALRNYQNIHFARPWSRGALHLAARKRVAGTKAWLRAHLPRTVWTSVKRAAGKDV